MQGAWPKSIALITDGRFSGASTGPVIGHCSPEAADGGPIALVEEGDLIEIDVMERKLNIIGIAGREKDDRRRSTQILAESDERTGSRERSAVQERRAPHVQRACGKPDEGCLSGMVKGETYEKYRA